MPTARQLVAASGLPARTVGAYLRRLTERGLVQAEPVLPGPRYRVGGGKGVAQQLRAARDLLGVSGKQQRAA
jgi:hypothetical protein